MMPVEQTTALPRWRRYVRTDTVPWDQRRVVHLHRRAAFAAFAFTFDENIDPAGAVPADVLAFTGPEGDLVPAITGVQTAGATVTVEFAAQTAAGSWPKSSSCPTHWFSWRRRIVCWRRWMTCWPRWAIDRWPWRAN